MSLVEEVGVLRVLNIDALRAQWRERFGTEPPKLRGPDMMRRALADRIQSEALGRDDAVDKRLAALVRAHLRGERVGQPQPMFRPGTLLTREHQGIMHHVEVLDAGFRWQGRHYKSLSEIARAITRVRWNGPKFFGLRPT
jgi:hypothetical protein